MHIAFAIVFFLFVGLCETLRHGIFGLTPSETDTIIFGTMLVLALFMLRGDAVFLLRRPRGGLYGRARLGWSWPRTALALALLPLVWAVPLAVGLPLPATLAAPGDPAGWVAALRDPLIAAIAVQWLVVALAQELFFREAVIKCFAADLRAVFLISGLSSFIFFVPYGVPAGLLAAAGGLVFLALRLIGGNILVVALAHAATIWAWSGAADAALAPGDALALAAQILAACAALSGLLAVLLAPRPARGGLHHA